MIRYPRYMPRPRRAAEGGLVYHALNRADARLAIFDFGLTRIMPRSSRVLARAVVRHEMRLLAYCLMPNHFHPLLWPRRIGDLSQFMRWLTVTSPIAGTPTTAPPAPVTSTRAGSSHSRWNRATISCRCAAMSSGTLRANLVERAEDWRWGSLSARRAKADKERPPLAPWPIARPRDWTARVNRPFGPKEEAAVCRSIQRGQPFGSPCRFPTGSGAVASPNREEWRTRAEAAIFVLRAIFRRNHSVRRPDLSKQQDHRCIGRNSR